jgi:hypothetical protein
MNEPNRNPPHGAGGGGRKASAMLGAVVLLGAAAYLSNSPLPPAPAAAAQGPKDKNPAAPTAGAVAAANAFLDALDAKQREKALLDFGSDKKPNWSNLPVTFVPRNGVKLGDLTRGQRDKAMGVVAAVLSKDGYQKVVDIMDGDQKLVDNPKGGGKGKGGEKGPMFGKDLYYLAIFGRPAETTPWMVQFGGHHLGVNVTVVGRHFVLTPTHTGAQPALFKRGNTEVRPLGRESDTAYKLMDALDEKQRKQAVIGERPQGALLLGPGRDGTAPPPPKGIKGSALTGEQQALLLDVVGAWVNIVEPEAAAARLAAVKEKIGETHFAWSGPTERGKAAYFRVQGPNVVIEYAPQGGTDHIHTVIRNPEDEYGAGSAKR